MNLKTDNMAELEFSVRIQVGDIYARFGMSKKLIGNGYDDLCKIIDWLSEGRTSPADIDSWLDCQRERIADNVEKFTYNVHIMVSEEVFNSIHVTTDAVPYHVFTMPELPEIKVMDAAILEEPERELPPYRSKLLAYDKRRNYSKKSYWNRIRSRCF